MSESALVALSRDINRSIALKEEEKAKIENDISKLRLAAQAVNGNFSLPKKIKKVVKSRQDLSWIPPASMIFKRHGKACLVSYLRKNNKVGEWNVYNRNKGRHDYIV